MSLLDDVEKLVTKAANDIGSAKDDLTQDLKNGIQTINDAASALQTALKQDATNLETDFASILKQAAKGWNTFSSDLNTIRSVISTWYTSTATTTAIANLESMAKQLDLKDAHGQLMPLYNSLTTAVMNAPGADAKALAKIFQEYGTFSVSIGGDADILAGFDGGIGFATKTGNDADRRFTADLAVGLGALEIDAFQNVGLWNKSPHDMKGAYLAVSAAAADGAGLSVAAIFEFPSVNQPIGFVFAVLEVEAIAVDGALRYTMTWDAPATASAARPTAYPALV